MSALGPASEVGGGTRACGPECGHTAVTHQLPHTAPGPPPVLPFPPWSQEGAGKKVT